MKRWIKNFDELAVNENRKIVMDIAEAGLSSIDTESVVLSSLKLSGEILSIMDQNFDLSKFKKIKVVGFGKASCVAAAALEKVLGPKIMGGVVIGISKTNCERIETFAGTHPKPSRVNIEAGKKIYEIAKGSSEEDLIIALISGGGSALLCHSENECRQNISLYDQFLKSGGTIEEINIIRKHLSVLKGGGLAKIAYPATVIGLIFSDIPGDYFDDVSSGPTYKDESTITDALRIVEKYNLGKFDLLETPKDDKYFNKVHNFVLVSNKIALAAMGKKSKDLGLNTNVISAEIYDEVETAISRIFKANTPNTVILAGGEPKLEVKNIGGSGGRNSYIALKAIDMGLVGKNSVFFSLASDGLDNSDAAGAIIDIETIEKIRKLNLNVKDYLERFDSYSIFKKSGDLVITGPTGANVSDLMILLNKE